MIAGYQLIGQDKLLTFQKAKLAQEGPIRLQEAQNEATRLALLTPELLLLQEQNQKIKEENKRLELEIRLAELQLQLSQVTSGEKNK